MAKLVVVECMSCSASTLVESSSSTGSSLRAVQLHVRIQWTPSSVMLRAASRLARVTALTAVTAHAHAHARTRARAYAYARVRVTRGCVQPPGPAHMLHLHAPALYAIATGFIHGTPARRRPAPRRLSPIKNYFEFSIFQILDRVFLKS